MVLIRYRHPFGHRIAAHSWITAESRQDSPLSPDLSACQCDIIWADRREFARKAVVKVGNQAKETARN